MVKRVYIGFDHNGYKLASEIMEILISKDIGVNQPFDNENETVDYPDICKKVCDCVLSDAQSIGILICGTGIGMDMCANRIKGIRAVLAKGEDEAYYARRHEDANCLVLASGYTDGKKKILKTKNIENIINTFIQTEFEAGRHIERVKKLDNV